MDSKEIKDLILTTKRSTMQLSGLVILWGLANYFNNDEYTFIF
jgi:hypothetical protein